MSKIHLVIILFFIASIIFAQNQANLDNQFRQALNFEQAMQYEAAEKIYIELYRTQPHNYSYYEALNRVYISQKKYDQSVRLIEAKIKITPQDPNLYGMLGTTFHYMNKPERADSVWKLGIDTNINNPIACRVIANYAIENRSYNSAIEILKIGKGFSGGDPTMFSFDLGNIYAANMKFREAADEYSFLVITRPELLSIVKTRIASYINRPEAYMQTIEVIKEKLNSTLELYDLLTSVYQASGNFDKAFANTVESEKRFKKDGTDIFLFAQEAFRSGKYDWAATAYEYIKKNYPASPFVMTAKLGSARSLEYSLENIIPDQSDSWKPVKLAAPQNPIEYKKIIDLYEAFSNEYKENAASVEALFRAAEIYRTKLLNYHKADSLYQTIIRISPNSNYTVQSNLGLGKISVMQNNLTQAEFYFENSTKLRGDNPEEMAEVAYYLAKLKFWKGEFKLSASILNSLAANLSLDISNDVLELLSLLSSAKRDSISLAKYALADLQIFQNKYNEAITELKTLADNANLFIINEFTRIKLAELFLVFSNYNEAELLLQMGMDTEKNSIFADKCTFLLAQTYFYGKNERANAVKLYENILAKFPNSLYFARARAKLNELEQNLP